MVRFISVILLAVFLFNLIGYYGVYTALRTQANNELHQQLDDDKFNQNETITIKIPLTAPYQSSSYAFERVNGEFEKDGTFYDLVHQKLEQDTLVIVAVKDVAETSLFQALVDFVETTTDNPSSQKAGKLLENIVCDFTSHSNQLMVANYGWMKETTFIISSYSIISATQKINSPPPRA